jgi:hypothetical protein
MTDEAENEYSALRTFDALAAYLYRKHGAECVRTIFHQIGDFACEDFEPAIKVLEERGLGDVAQVMEEIAAEYPSGRTFNPYGRDDWCNWLHWDRSWSIRRRMVTGQTEAALRRQKPRKPQ